MRQAQSQGIANQIPASGMASEGNNIRKKYFVKGTNTVMNLTQAQFEELRKNGVEFSNEEQKIVQKYKRSCFTCNKQVIIFKTWAKGSWKMENMDGSVHEHERKTYKRYQGRNWGTCWECGCEGNLDSEGYCGC